MPWIQNVSFAAIEEGKHMSHTRAILIQIVDVDRDFPTPKNQFVETHQFKFNDIEDRHHSTAITEEQSDQIAEILKRALESNLSVVVHCIAGLCRSGAVTDAGVAMGFTDTGSLRIPNVLVKRLLFKSLGYSYESTVPPYKYQPASSGGNP